MAWIAAAAAVGSAVVSAYSARQANKSNESISDKQMEFQRQMSDTQYQRGMADMRTAGLNPMLAYNQGGASSPSGSSWTAQPIVGNNDIAGSINTARKLDIDEKRTIADTNLTENKDKTEFSIQALTDAQRRKTDQDRKNLKTVDRLNELNIHSAKRDAQNADTDAKLLKENSWLRELSTVLRALGITGNSAMGTLRK